MSEQVGYCRTIHHGSFSTNAAHTQTPQCVGWRERQYTGINDGPDLTVRAGEFNHQRYGQWKPWSDDNVAEFANSVLVEECDRLTRNWQLRWKETNDRAELLEQHLKKVISEAWFVLSGGDNPSDKCTECGCAGYGMLRAALHDAAKALAGERGEAG